MFSNSQRTVLSAGKPMQNWSFTVNTAASASGEKKASIPFNIYASSTSGVIHYGGDVNSPISKMIVDWGDGTKTTLKSDDFSGPHDSSKIIHEYRTAGTYTITISCAEWNKVYLDCPTYQNAHVLVTQEITASGLYKNYYYFQRTLTKINTPFPGLAGSRYYRNETQYGILGRMVTAAFAGCTHLTSLPSKLFGNLSNMTDYFNTFNACTGLTSIPADLFGTVDVEDIEHLFEGCTGLRSIPQNLFAKMPSLTNVDGNFAGCTSITSIPQNLFASNPNIAYFRGIFYKCPITSIPATLFSACTKAVAFQGAFAYTKITSIPETLFKTCTSATDFNATFERCASLTSIPATLFRYNTNASNFQGTFAYCTSITSIPAALFKYNTKATVFGSGGSSGYYGSLDGCFEKTAITSVPAHLFDTNKEVTSFFSCFRGCASLRSIPDNLLLYNTKIKSIQYFISGCTSLTSFNIHIKAKEIILAYSFMSKDTQNTKKKVYVPKNSTTYTTFTNYETTSSSYYTGLIVIGE